MGRTAAKRSSKNAAYYILRSIIVKKTITASTTATLDLFSSQ